jgi:hypothetical protein
MLIKITITLGNGWRLRVVIFREGDIYVAQCLEVDVGTQAADIPKLLERLALTIDAEYLDKLPPAPPHFFWLWRGGLI